MPGRHSLRIQAHAKINLALSVGPAMPPKGYHPICSWMAPIDLHDTLTVEKLGPSDASTFSISWAADAPRPTPIDWPIADDLAARSHAILESHAGMRLPVRATLDKRTPVGGGLGGGSSDAAAMLRGLRLLFDLPLSHADLRALSTKLGSDIAYFIDEIDDPSLPPPRTAIVSGLGERIERVAAVAADLLLFIPPFGCPTGPVYRALDRLPNPKVQDARVRELARSSALANRIDPRSLFNDLAEPACSVEPRLTETITRLHKVLGDQTPVHVTGSGSTLFALVAPGEVIRLSNRIRSDAPDLVSVPTMLI